MSPASRALKFFALGSAGGAPLLLLGEFGQVSKSTRQWTVKVNNPDGASIEFTESPTKGGNELLKGRWTFLNKKKSEESNLFSKAFFDIAVQEVSTATSFGEPSLATGIARHLVCSKGDTYSDKEPAKAGNGGTNGYCKDVTNSWYYGFIRGGHYGATFAVNPKGILKNGYKSTSMEDLERATRERTGIINDTLLEILKLTAKPKNQFNGLAGNVNNGREVYEAKKYKQDWCGGNVCFQWVIIASKSNGEDDSKNNCKEDDSLSGCDIGIIDVSRYTLQKHQIVK